MEFQLGSKVEEIGKSTVTYNDGSGSKEIEGDLVLRGGNRSPAFNVSGLGFEDIGSGIFLRGESKVDDKGATNLPGVWAAGDVTGRAWLAHAASRDGRGGGQ